MKPKSILFLILVTATYFQQRVEAQIPEKMSYQAVIRDSLGRLVANRTIGMRIRILENSMFGSTVYMETHTPTTNENGLVSIEIGGGTVDLGSISTIDWAKNQYYIETQIDINGGANYQISSTSQILSVPYAFYAKTVGNGFNGSYNDLTDKPLLSVSVLGDTLYLEGSNYVIIPGISSANYPESDSVIDMQGNIYKTVKIGNQTWMAENLAYLPVVVPTTAYGGYYVYGYNGTNVDEARATDNYKTYGVLYTWDAAMKGSTSSSTNPSGVQGVCPLHWHLPSDAEWEELTTYLGGIEVAGGKMKETDTIHWNSPNEGATNSSGFLALPGGYGDHPLPHIWSMGTTAGWWSATEKDFMFASHRALSYQSAQVFSSYTYKDICFSVRCIRDY